MVRSDAPAAVGVLLIKVVGDPHAFTVAPQSWILRVGLPTQLNSPAVRTPFSMVPALTTFWQSNSTVVPGSEVRLPVSQLMKPRAMFAAEVSLPTVIVVTAQLPFCAHAAA